MTNSIIQPAIDAFQERTPLRVGSLLVTIFGDSVLPYGDFVKLSSLLEITSAIGIDDGAVRVAIHRLEKVGWLKKHKVGRNAHYGLGKAGEEESRQAAKLIYDFEQPQSFGELQMLVLREGSGRAEFRDNLVASGWGLVAPNILLTSGSDQQLAALENREKETPDFRFPLNAETEDIRRLCIKGFELDELNVAYRAYVELYQNILNGKPAPQLLNMQDALILRILMIHDYRRLILKEPRLAPYCLPKDWYGNATRKLLFEHYPVLKKRTKNWMD